MDAHPYRLVQASERRSKTKTLLGVVGLAVGVVGVAAWMRLATIDNADGVLPSADEVAEALTLYTRDAGREVLEGRSLRATVLSLKKSGNEWRLWVDNRDLTVASTLDLTLRGELSDNDVRERRTWPGSPNQQGFALLDKFDEFLRAYVGDTRAWPRTWDTRAVTTNGESRRSEVQLGETRVRSLAFIGDGKTRLRCWVFGKHWEDER